MRTNIFVQCASAERRDVILIALEAIGFTCIRKPKTQEDMLVGNIEVSALPELRSTDGVKQTWDDIQFSPTRKQAS